MKKFAVPVIVSAIAMIAATIVLGYLFNFLFPSVKTEYENTSLFRPMDDPLMYLYFLQPFLLTWALVWGWNKIKSHFQGSTAIKAFNLSLVYLFIATLPGLLMSVSSFKISILMTAIWIISSFVQVWVASLIIIRMNK